MFFSLQFYLNVACDNLASNFASTMVNENISEAIIHEYGWYNSFMEGDQYRFPTVQETEMVFDACTGADTQFLLEGKKS